MKIMIELSTEDVQFQVFFVLCLVFLSAVKYRFDQLYPLTQTDGYIRCMYKAVKKTKVINRYMESFALHTVAPTVHWEDNKGCISVVEAKMVTPRVKHSDIPVCFLL